MKKKIDWLNHSVSFAVVLTGILLAFQLTQCSEDRKQQRTIENHKRNILAETEVNKGNLIWTLNSAEKNLAIVDSLIWLIREGEDLKTINKLSIELLTTGSAHFKKNAYNALVESGDIRFMKDFDGKSETINLYEYYKSTEFSDYIGYQYSYNPYSVYLLDNFDMLNNKVQKEDVYLSKKFGNLIGSYKYFLQQRVDMYKTGKENIDNYLELTN